ncbi:MAG: glycosyltransferase involved in cell wall biosynthesis [Sphingobacteriales bacterium]|jgi:glycosyltransferase involved in cell wall biosynthesis
MHLLIIGQVWPEPRSSAAGTRMIQLITLFRESGYRITFASTAKPSEVSENETTLGVETAQIKLNDSSFDSWIADLNPDVVIFDRFMIEEQFGWRVADNCPQALTILDTEDLHFLRKAREVQIKKGGELNVFTAEASREIASIMRCDLSLIISDFEKLLLEEKFKISSKKLHYLPLFVKKLEKTPGFEGRNNFVTIGNFLHPPNLDGVIYLFNEVWPKIRKSLPEAQMHVYGAYPPEKIKQYQKPKLGFHIMGRAEDAFEVVSKARVLLAPLRFGAGLKGKMLDALCCETPSITTLIGAEGIATAAEWPGFVSDSPEELSAEATKLHEDKEVWNNANKKGVAILAKFNKIQFASSFVKRVGVLKNGIEKHREENFLGRVFHHQTIGASRFMSKWIEEKNKSK